MESTKAVNNMLSFIVWLIAFNSYIQLSNSVSIITASNKPQRVHWSSATNSQRDQFKLPSSIIVSTSLGLRDRPKPGEANTDNGNKRHQVIPAVEENRGTAGQYGVRDKIKFYKLECTKGSTCSSVIPARNAKRAPMRASRFSPEQLARYFRLFNPSNKDTESRKSASPVNSVNKNEGPGNKREGRHFENYWPSSDQRPQSHQYVQLINDFKQSFPSKAKVTKYETISSSHRISPELNFPTRRPAKRPTDTTARPWWEEIDSVYPDSENDSDKISYPNYPPSSISRPVSIQSPTTSHHSTGNKGSWRRYGTSTVSQLNKNTGEWEKVSTSNTQLNGSSPSARPLGTKDDVYKASAALTVLGVSDREPHSAFIDSVAHKPQTILVPSSDPDKPPHKIETDNTPAAVTQTGVTFTVFRPKPSTPSNISSHKW